ncbi:TIR domain-containing protein [Roseibium aggregatum]|uniref:TIR domain-containing protein n=1 Tax=Roseibium aggregatum TaxID=187304 RepID=A0A926P1K1_9HYPH|nr:TIR domain-containing protein [Roseibium aggregatum]MBD1547758.1 TIR domain-containing protein [Roseibium aggregatum]
MTIAGDGANRQARDFRYAGFISYSQKDKAWAKRIHRALERYRLPAGLPEEKRKRNRLGRFFRDDDELAGAPSLGAALEGAIDDAGALIVICSPNAAQSKWVDAEVRRFKQRGPSARVFAVIVAGRPDADNPDEQCFPPSLLSRVDADGNLTGEPDEPLAPDATKEGFPRLVTRLAAGLIGVGFDALWQRERRRRLRQKIVAGVAAVALIAGSATGYVLVRDAKQRELRSESLALAGAAQTALDEGRLQDALSALRTALPADLDHPDRPVVPQALTALRRALADSTADGVLARFEEPVRALRMTGKRRLAVFLDSGAIVTVDPDTGAKAGTLAADRRYRPLGTSGLVYTVANDEHQLADGTWTIDNSAVVADPDTGKTLKTVAATGNDWWFKDAVSPDGSRVLASATQSGSHKPTELAVFALQADGNDGAGPQSVVDVPTLDTDVHLSAAFGDDDTVFLSWGDKRKTLAVWNTGEHEPRILVEPDDTPGCGESGPVDEDRQDSVVLSPDRKLVTHTRHLADDTLCVRIWDGRTGDPVSEQVLTEARASTVMALTPELLALSKDHHSMFSDAELRSADGARWPVKGCGSPLSGSLTLEASLDRWITDQATRISACVSGDAITVLAGPAWQPAGSYRGHANEVAALWLDGPDRQLWSGGADGTVRRWTIPQGSPLKEDLQPVTPAVAGGPHVAALFRQGDGGLILQAFDGAGTAVSPRIPFRPAPVPEGTTAPRRNVAPVLLAGGQTVGIAEAFDCGFLACPDGLQNRLTLWRVKDGSSLLQVDGMAPGGFLKQIPVALHLAGDQALLRLRDGTARIVDLSNGSVRATITPPDGSYIRDAAFAHGHWWLVQDDSPQDPDKRNVELLRLPESLSAKTLSNGDLKTVDRRLSQDGTLYAAPDGSALMIAHRYSNGGAQTALSVVAADGTLAATADLPEAAYAIEDVTFPATSGETGTAALLFGDAAPPMLMDLASGALTPLASAQAGSAHDTWRVEDPLRRAFVSTDNSRLSILAYAKTDPGALCPSLDGTAADAAAFNGDGSRLAVADGDGQVKIFDIETCTVERTASVWASGLKPLAFAADGTLWIRDSDGPFRLVPPPPADAELLQRLRRIGGTMQGPGKGAGEG